MKTQPTRQAPRQAPRKPTRQPWLAYSIVAGLVAWALACDAVRFAWRYAQAHPVQAAGWLLGGVVIAIVVITLLYLAVED